MADNKLVRHVGTSINTDGDCHIRFCYSQESSYRKAALKCDGHRNIIFYKLPRQMKESGAIKWLKTNHPETANALPPKGRGPTKARQNRRRVRARQSKSRWSNKPGSCISRKDLIAQYESRGQAVIKKPLPIPTPTIDSPPVPEVVDDWSWA